MWRSESESHGHRLGSHWRINLKSKWKSRHLVVSFDWCRFCCSFKFYFHFHHQSDDSKLLLIIFSFHLYFRNLLFLIMTYELWPLNLELNSNQIDRSRSKKLVQSDEPMIGDHWTIWAIFFVFVQILRIV